MRKLFNHLVCAAVVLALALPAGAAPAANDPSDTAMESIRPEAIRAHMNFLADDLLEGRGANSRGYEISARYMATEFALLTMLMKNSLLDEIGKDYMRTALVKGASLRTAVWKHALRNALVPIATRASEIFTLMFAGSVLIERVFDIDGMGLLFFNSTVSRDYNVVLGIILLSSVMGLVGRLFADFLYVVVDPRIKLQ